MTPDNVLQGLAAAVAEQRIAPARAELLIGFVAGRAADFPPPSIATFRRRASELQALGLPAPEMPDELRRDSVGAVRRRRRLVA